MVPTPMVKRDLDAHGFPNVKLWSRGVDTQVFQMPPTPSSPRLQRGQPGWPIFLYAGRVAVEKGVEEFLALDLPGQKWVVGDGPALDGLKEQYPDARYFGFLNQTELARVYQQASVFVFPSRTDTFGLVLLEAMATGLPVAAYPVSGACLRACVPACARTGVAYRWGKKPA
jgi:glycosyltransferase involved in cell wall biosynthesis